MYCPKCRREFKKGIKVCTVCQVKLVKKLPAEAEPKTENLDLINIRSFRDQGQASLLEDFLTKKGIHVLPVEYQFKKIIRLFVRRQDLEKTETLLKNYETESPDQSVADEQYKKKGKATGSNFSIGHFVIALVLFFFGIGLWLFLKRVTIGLPVAVVGIVYFFIFVLMPRFKGNRKGI